MTINELILTRESCREYSDKKVTLEQLTAIVEVARMAPSAANTQPWNFYVTNNPESVAKIASGCMAMDRNGFAGTVSAFIVMTRNVESETWVPATPYNHYYRDFDCGSAATHVCFAATDIGLSTCMIGWFDDEPLKEVCGYSDDQRASLVFTVGYAATDKIRDKNRRSLDDVMTIV
ncbi:MAG: nitroreductase family protein [Oscillospiraceae bacterium]|nr:nitroreductase family protein [Oscillospiraceae bacterium]